MDLGTAPRLKAPLSSAIFSCMEYAKPRPALTYSMSQMRSLMSPAVSAAWLSLSEKIDGKEDKSGPQSSDQAPLEPDR